MKKLFLLLLTSIIFLSCDDSIDPTEEYYNSFKVIEIDNCEYVIRRDGYAGYLSHKGNCKFCTERHKKEYTEIIDSLFLMQD